MKLNSHNEWDPLKVVIVGSVENFAPGVEFPADCPTAVQEESQRIVAKACPQWYVDEVAEDLATLCAVFKEAGVEVLRPRWTEASTRFATPNWAAAGFDLYNVRDLHIVFGDMLVVSAPASRFRFFEAFAFRDLLDEHFFDEGFRWVCAPPPRLRGEYLRAIEVDRNELQEREDDLHERLSHGLTETFHRLAEAEVIFDAANVVRLGRDVLFLVSSTGNRKAALWLQSILGPRYKVHLTHSYRSSHLDSTILPLRPGLVLLNGARVSDATAPDVFDRWDRIYFTDVAPLPEEEVEIHRTLRLPAYHELQGLGVGSQLNHVSSPWAGLNVMSIDPDTVLVHDRQKELIDTLEAKRLTVVPVQIRHIYTMLGGLHCSTLDVVRASNA